MKCNHLSVPIPQRASTDAEIRSLDALLDIEYQKQEQNALLKIQATVRMNQVRTTVGRLGNAFRDRARH